MKVEIDDKSGFCFGVVRAISAAEEALQGEGQVSSLGDIVHNRVEVQRLEDMGLATISHDEIARTAGGKLIIRAHGEPPSTYEEAGKCGVTLIDATCPVVAHLQKIVTEAHARMKEAGGQVVIFGKRGHAEVVGLAGQVGGDVIVIEGLDDLEQIDFARPVYLLSQTTQSLDLFNEVSGEILRRSADKNSVTIHDTICRQVSNRAPHLREFASAHDVVVFVCGRKSSNGKALFEACAEANPRSYKVEDETEIDPSWFSNANSVGICGATSTPKWLMERVAEYVRCLPPHG